MVIGLYVIVIVCTGTAANCLQVHSWK